MWTHKGISVMEWGLSPPAPQSGDLSSQWKLLAAKQRWTSEGTSVVEWDLLLLHGLTKCLVGHPPSSQLGLWLPELPRSKCDESEK